MLTRALNVFPGYLPVTLLLDDEQLGDLGLDGPLCTSPSPWRPSPRIHALVHIIFSAPTEVFLYFRTEGRCSCAAPVVVQPPATSSKPGGRVHPHADITRCWQRCRFGRMDTAGLPELLFPPSQIVFGASQEP